MISIRIWHYQLLPYLPDAQFKGQLRELVAIMHDWRDKGKTNHLLINKVMEYPKNSIDIIEMEIMPDHVHLLIEVDSQFGIHKTIKRIKGRTSRILRQELPWLAVQLPMFWTNSYFVSTVGGVPLSIIKQYIENQKMGKVR